MQIYDHSPRVIVMDIRAFLSSNKTTKGLKRASDDSRTDYRTEITQLLCVNRNPIWYGFRADARALQYSCVDIPSNGLKMALNLTSGLNLITIWSIMHQEEIKGPTGAY